MRRRWKCTVKGGKLVLPNSVDFERHIQAFEDKHVEVTVKKWEPFSTDKQFAYYYGVVLHIISEHTGHTRDDLDSILKHKFLYEFVTMGDTIERRLLSKNEVSKQRFSEYIEQVIQWATTSLGLTIPGPDEATWESYV